MALLGLLVLLQLRLFVCIFCLQHGLQARAVEHLPAPGCRCFNVSAADASEGPDRAGLVCECAGWQKAAGSWSDAFAWASLRQACTDTPTALLDLRLVDLPSGVDRPGRLPEAGCDWSRRLVNLSVTGGLTGLEAAGFAGLARLRRLSLSRHARLTDYGEAVFAGLAGLVELAAVGNPVRSLAKTTLRGLAGLEEVVFSANRLGFLPAGVFAEACCAGLRRLRLDGNLLTVLEADLLTGLSRLEELDLRGNPIQRMDTGLFAPCRDSLVRLRVSHDDRLAFGGFPRLADGLLRDLRRLRLLQLDELKLTHFGPDDLVGLVSLEDVSLRGNRLTGLPEATFLGLPRLRRLDLSGNRLICLSTPTQASRLVPPSLLPARLDWLDLADNRLTHLTRRLVASLLSGRRGATLPFQLNISGNPWRQIDPDAFCPFTPNPAQPQPQPGLELDAELDTAATSPRLVLTIGPSPVSPTGWRSAVAVWHGSAAWPNGPLALIGPGNLLRGLPLDEATPRRGPQADLVYGDPEAEAVCARLARASADGEAKAKSAAEADAEDVRLGLASPVEVAASLASDCPRLPVHELTDWQLAQLGLPAGLHDLLQLRLVDTESTSRFYLLVIVAVCIAFLLSALTVIMCYRTWSRRASVKPSPGRRLAAEAGLRQSAGPPVRPERNPLLGSDAQSGGNRHSPQSRPTNPSPRHTPGSSSSSSSDSTHSQPATAAAAQPPPAAVGRSIPAGPAYSVDANPGVLMRRPRSEPDISDAIGVPTIKALGVV